MNVVGFSLGGFTGSSLGGRIDIVVCPLEKVDIPSILREEGSIEKSDLPVLGLKTVDGIDASALSEGISKLQG